MPDPRLDAQLLPWSDAQGTRTYADTLQTRLHASFQTVLRLSCRVFHTGVSRQGWTAD